MFSKFAFAAIANVSIKSGSRLFAEYFFPWISQGSEWRGREPEVFEADCYHQRHKEANYGTGKDHAPRVTTQSIHVRSWVLMAVKTASTPNITAPTEMIQGVYG